jgi:alanyl aminopeptidase
LFRLGHQVSPTHYSVNLTVTPGQPTFQGIIDIDLKFSNPTTQFWMNATALQISRAELRIGNATEPAKVELRDDRLAGISFDREIPAGDGQLHIEYSGKVSGNSSAGVFQLEEDGRWYLYTQFEPTDARRAFPCFDEPSFKVPWQVTLNVPKDAKAFANTPSISEKGQTGGRKIVKFGETRPLPSYLVAFAVGPFDVVDAGTAGAKHTKIRILTPQGKAASAKYAAAAIPDLLVLLEKYFAIPFPYEKLDSVAMPISNFAMENAGLITYGEQTLLGDPDDDTLTRQRSFAIVAAHEMAHQWFGDLVTTAWWDDIWLNEGFATWMETKIVNEWKPDWHSNVDAVDDSLEAMGLDSLVSARKIRQPILSESDIANAFDNITYMKGAAVLRMFENYIGPEVFRHGVQAYIKAHADKNATTDDFLAAISAANGRNVAPSFDTFLDQPGVPEVSATLRCNQNQPTLQLTQKRYLPLGSPGRKSSDSELWQIPVCARYAGSSECVLLTKHADEVRLASKVGCSAWLIPNAGANGYYHATVDLKAAAKDLTLPELVGSLGDVKALVESGGEKAPDALTIVPGFASNPERRVVEADTELASLTESTFMSGDTWPRAAAFIDHVFGPRARELGWEPRSTDDDEVRLLRHHLVRFAADAGDDPELVQKASELTQRWLKDHKAVNAGEVADVLQVAAAHGGRDLFDQLRAAAAASHDHRQRQAAISALGSFRDPAIAKDAIALLLTDDFDAREAYFALLFGPLDYPATRSLPFDFLKAHIDDLLKRLPREVGADFAADLPRVGEAFCDATKRDEIESFFKDRVKNFVGGPRTLEQTIEKIDVCIGEGKAIEPEIDRFLGDAAGSALARALNVR